MISDDLLNKTLEKVNKTTAAYNYFFNNINNPAWLLPLKEKGFFTKPTPAVREGSSIRFPTWPESGYLVRIADKAQDEVLAIIKVLPETDNERVMDDVVNALLKIDPSKAVRLTETIKKYINTSRFLMLHETTSELINKLADAGHVGAALGLAEEMLEVLPDPEREAKLKESYVMIEPAIKYRDYDYKSIIEKITPSLTKAAPMAIINLYSGLLQKAILYEFTTFKEGDEGVAVEEKKDDLSFISRPNIADDKEHGHGPEDILVTALRDSVTALMQNASIEDIEKLAQLKDLATNYKYSVYRRIVEFALRDHKDNVTFKIFYDSLLTDKKLQSVLDAEKNGFNKITSGFVTERPTDLLKDLSDPELIEKLKTYKDESGWSFDRDSMTKELGELIRLDPRRFVPLVKNIATTKNEYLDEAIRAFEEVVDNLDEESIVGVLRSLVEIYRAGNTVEGDEQRDYYSWSKATSIRLVEKLLSKKEDQAERITARSLSVVTELILFLCREESPSGEDDSNFEPVDLSINSTRGKALHAVAYLLTWMNRNSVDKTLYKPIFDELDWHLNPKNDALPAIRTVYGWRFEVFYGTDKDWALKNMDAIFTDDASGWAAFDAYVMFNRVHEEGLKILGDVFMKQLPRLASPSIEDGKSRHDGLKNFVQHLALHYWYNDIDLSDESMISLLLKTADKKYINELANFVGFRLYKDNGLELKEDQIKKLVELWEATVELTKSDKTKLEALEEFGSWFASGKFDPQWSLEQLTYAASKGKNINLDYAALKYMKTLTGKYPAESLKALSAMIDGTRERWAVSSWSEDATAVIQTAYGSTDQAVRQSAVALANKLVAKGYTEYRNIVKGL